LTIGGNASLGLVNGTAMVQTGSGSLVLNGSTQFGSAASFGYLDLDGGWTLTNGGDFTWTNGTIEFGFNRLTGAPVGGATILNNSGSIFDVAFAGSIANGLGTNVFDNIGTVTTDGLSGTAVIGVAFDNFGALDGTSGTLTLAGGGVSTGSFTIASGAVVQFNGGDFVLNGGSGSGAGTLLVAGGEVTVSGDTTLGTGFGQNGGILDGSATLTIGGSGSLGLVNGNTMVQTGSGSLVLNGSTQFGSGASFGYLDLDGGWTLTNGGDFTWANGTIEFGFNRLTGGPVGGATIANDVGAVFDIAVAGTITNGLGTNVFDNAGTVTTDGLSGAATIGVAFANTGTVDITGGELDFTGPLSGGGSLVVSGGGIVNLEANVAANVTFAGAGTLILPTAPNAAGGYIGTTSGFAAGDVIDLNTLAFDPSLKVIAASSGPGLVTLFIARDGDITQTVATAGHLAGDYANSVFVLTQDATGGTELQLGEFPGSVSIGDMSVAEGDSGTKTLTFTATRTGGTAAFDVDFATADGTATASSDYQGGSGTLHFGTGVNTQQISITINGDTVFEPDQTFLVNLSNPTNGAALDDAQATGTILNDDPTPPPPAGSVSIGDMSISEGDGGSKILTFTVTRTGGTAAFNVGFATADGTATAGSDYQGSSGALHFGTGVNTKQISITINGDTVFEPDETFAVNLSNPTNGATIDDGQAIGTILNDDRTSAVPNDFNGDRTSDILWQGTTGAVVLWGMSGDSVVSSSFTGFADPASWSIKDTGDFNGDGTSDILWQDTAGDVVVWRMSDGSVASSDFAGFADPASWSIKNTGDFNGDGTSDILWQDTAGDVVVWGMSGDSVVASSYLGFADPASWSIKNTGDFNGDGTSDILWQDTAGDVVVWGMSGGSVASSDFVGFADPASWAIVPSDNTEANASAVGSSFDFSDIPQPASAVISAATLDGSFMPRDSGTSASMILHAPPLLTVPITRM
jgi:hypothetical protein